MTNRPYFRSTLLEAAVDPASSAVTNATLGEVIASRLSRRELLKGSLAVSAAAAAAPLSFTFVESALAASGSAFDFAEVETGNDDLDHVAEGYEADVLLRWGDPLFTDAPAFDPEHQSAEAQLRQFGYNNDFVGYIPIDGASDHGLLVVNHEFTSEHLMFPDAILRNGAGEIEMAPASMSRVDVEIAAHGGSVVEVRKSAGRWRPVLDSPFNRRITAATPMEIAGPARGHERLATSTDPAAARALGTLNNCAGGVTPWNTYLMAEENFHGYFWGTLAEGHPETQNYERYGVPGWTYTWGLFHERFDVGVEPNEPNRFGWVVEVDPFDPDSVPKKRTALGRFRHEGAESVVARDGRVVLYMGDDQTFEYAYKFVTSGRFDPQDRAANMDLLDAGTLFVARFQDDGTLAWLPMVAGEGPLTAANGFASQADVVIEARRAADLLGATRMDRSEDFEANPVTGKVYLMLSKNSGRTGADVDAANPRANNAFGHVIEIIEDDGDFAAASGRWEILLRCGDPSVAEVGATFSMDTSSSGWFSAPDNCVFDSLGRLWIATDGAHDTGRADGLFAVDTEGALRRTSRLFYRAPLGAELCGPAFTPDDETLFVAIQHPAEGVHRDEPSRPSHYADPSTRWPDFDPALPPRPSVVAITRRGGGKIGR